MSDPDCARYVEGVTTMISERDRSRRSVRTAHDTRFGEALIVRIAHSTSKE